MCKEFFDYCFNFTSCYQSIRASCFLDSVWEDYMFLEIFFISSRFSNFLAYSCSWQFLTTFCISVVSVVTSPLSFLILFGFSLFFLMSQLKGLSILFIFSKNQLLYLLILWIVLLVSMSFNSALILIISFLLLSLGFVCCCSFRSCRCRVRLFV